VNPIGIAVASDGSICVVNNAPHGAGDILKIDPVTGAQTIVSGGGYFSSPSGIAIVSAPEPSTALLVAGGTAWLAVVRGRRRQQAAVMAARRLPTTYRFPNATREAFSEKKVAARPMR
jgi:hypothetical protein